MPTIPSGPFSNKLRQIAGNKRIKLLLVVIAFVVIGTALMALTRAETPALTFESEAGSLSGAATAFLDSSASGGAAIIFGQAAPTGPAFYVSPSGSDSNAGTIGSPWKTLVYAAGKLTAGTTLYVRAGTYVEKVRFSQSGTATQPINILAYPGEKPVIDGQLTLPATTTNGDLVSFAGSYIKADGLEVRNSLWAGVAISGTNVTLSHFTSHDNMEQGIIGWGSTNATVEDSVVYSNAKSLENGVHYGGRTTYATGISAGVGADRSMFRRNRIYNNWGEGLSSYNATNTTMEDNIVYDNSKNIYISDTTGNLVQRNLVYCTAGNKNRLSSVVTQHGINLQDEDQKPASTNNVIINNFVVGCVTNFKWYPYTSNSAMINTLVANNVFMNATGTSSSDASFKISAPTGISHSGSRVVNNIIVQEDTMSIGQISEPSGGITFANNVWSKTPPSVLLGSSSMVANPLLAKIGSLTPGALTADYFKITSQSPAIDKGASLSEVKEDYFRTTRPRGAAYDIGGHEF